jgi:hypothetical protein
MNVMRYKLVLIMKNFKFHFILAILNFFASKKKVIHQITNHRIGTNTRV